MATCPSRRDAPTYPALPALPALLPMLVASLALAAAWVPDAWPAQAPAPGFIGRPIYSEPAVGLQLPPACEVDPSWRSPVNGKDFEIWVALCSGTARVWLLKRQVVEVVNARQSRLRFQVLDERIYPEEVAGESLSVQCTGPNDEPGYVVRGARWRNDGRQMRLSRALGVLRADTKAQRLEDTEVGAVDCARFPEREAMMKRLQHDH